MKKYILIIILIAALAFVFWWGGNAPGLHGWVTDEPENETEQLEEVTMEPVVEEVVEPTPSPVPLAPKPVEQEVVADVVDNVLDCTLIIRCDTILNNLEYLQPEKHALIPENGLIYSASNIAFNEGDTVFDVLLNELKAKKMHLEFVSTPAYKSVYIEGINNLYEFDCGELSGWMYKVNGEFPNYGCSLYKLNDNDTVEFIYTCDFGKDVGGDYFAQRGEANE